MRRVIEKVYPFSELSKKGKEQAVSQNRRYFIKGNWAKQCIERWKSDMKIGYGIEVSDIQVNSMPEEVSFSTIIPKKGIQNVLKNIKQQGLILRYGITTEFLARMTYLVKITMSSSPVGIQRVQCITFCLQHRKGRKHRRLQTYMDSTIEKIFRLWAYQAAGDLWARVEAQYRHETMEQTLWSRFGADDSVEFFEDGRMYQSKRR